jgi:hypothetical protein
MKKLFRTMIAVAVAAAAMTSCSKEMQEVTEVTGTPINVTMQGPETKAVFGTPSGTTYPVVWQENDEVKFMALKTPGEKVAVRVVEGKKYTVTVAEEGKKASFTAETPSAATTPYQFFVLSPYSAFVSCGDDATNNDYIQYAVPASQTPTATSVDPAAIITLGVSTQTADVPASLDLTFQHLTAYGLLTLNNLSTGGKAVKSVTLTFDESLGATGRWMYHPSTGTTNVNNKGNVITINTDKTENLFFACAPVEISGTKLTVTVAIEGGNLIKEITVPADKTFKAGIVSKFAIDMTGAKEEKAKVFAPVAVADLATLKAGDQIIIASVDQITAALGRVAISTTQNTSNRNGVSIGSLIDSDGKLVNPTSGVQIITLKAGTVDNCFLMETEEGQYLYCSATSAKNQLRTGAGTDEKANWKIYADGDKTRIASQTTNTNWGTGKDDKGPRIYIEFNKSDGKGACYPLDSQAPACIFRLDATTPPAPKVVDIWVNDATGNTPVDGGAEAKSDDWLSYAGGVATWTANTTNAPRTKTLELADGAKITVTQLEAKDFKGTYDFTTKAFCTDGFITAGNKQTISNITFGEPLLGETLKDGNNVEHTNTIGINGLYHAGIIADAAVDIDYKEQSVKLGVFLDGRKAQKDNSLTGEYQYVAFLPGLCAVSAAGSFAKPWTFCNPDLGEPDYEWLWFDTTDLTTFTYSCAKVAQKLSTGGYSATPYILGICINVFKAEEATSTNAKGNYNVVYQFNIDAGNVGLQFKRKTEN